ncbi:MULTISPECIES: EamA family transporter [Arenibacter]|uniref:EamA family transporter n=1 Tax=Arenibacter TaxID=178469 RepID=UPI000A3C932A|nr:MULTISPECIES: EamA family transporter [Arenibacter]
MTKTKHPFMVILAFFAIYVIWGSTYLFNKIAVQELPPFMLASVRFTVAGLLIFLLCKILGIPLTITRKQLKNCIIAGFLFLSVGNGFVVWSLQYVDSGLAALEIAAQPLVVLLLMRILQGKKIMPMSLLGVALGILGIFLLVSQNQIVSNENTLVGMAMIFMCMLSWAFSSLFVARADLPTNYFVNTGFQMFSGGIILMIGSLVIGEPWSLPSQWSSTVLYSLGFLILFGSILAFTAFNYLLKIVSPEKVATSTYVNPIIALLLGWLYLEEQITTQSAIAALVLLTGVYFINTKKKLVLFSRFSSKN